MAIWYNANCTAQSKEKDILLGQKWSVPSSLSAEPLIGIKWGH